MHNFYPILAIFLILLLPPKPRPHPSEPRDGGKNPDSRYVILVPSTDTNAHHSFPLLAPISPSDPRIPIARQLFETTFIREMIPLHDSIQEILLLDGTISEKEPLYLLLSGRMGGFPRMGFYLRLADGIVDKTGVPYVDLPTLEEDYARLSSPTQIYPHELAHIFYRQLTQKDPEAAASFSSDIHYFSIVTDYDKAFNEGYAESYENLARLHEPNRLVKEGTRADMERLQGYLPRYIRGFEKDYTWPLRLGYYRMSMVLWFQQLEDYKRYEWAEKGYAKYPPSGFQAILLSGIRHPVSGIRHPVSGIRFRNACVSFDSTRLLTPAQAASTEGVISSFFTILRGDDPPMVCLPKEFTVIHTYLRDLPAGMSPLHAFIDGYITEFPEERERVLHAWREASGRDYMPGHTPEIWILNTHIDYPFWVMDQFNGATLPFYTFNLNTARTEELLTLPGISMEEADRMISYRDSAGWFTTVDDVMAIPGIAPEKSAIFANNLLVPEVLDSMEYEGNIGLWSLLSGILLRFLAGAVLMTGALSLLLFLLFYVRKKHWKKGIIMVIRTFFKSLLFLLAGLAGVVLLPHPSFMILGFTLLLVVINLLRTRKNPGYRIELIISTLILALATTYSVL